MTETVGACNCRWNLDAYQYGCVMICWRPGEGGGTGTGTGNEFEKSNTIGQPLSSVDPVSLRCPSVSCLSGAWRSSWGAVYFAESWMEYRLYLAARLREDYVNVNIDNSKTNA